MMSSVVLSSEGFMSSSDSGIDDANSDSCSAGSGVAGGFSVTVFNSPFGVDRVTSMFDNVVVLELD